VAEVVPQRPVAPNAFLVHLVIGKSADARVPRR
jgi:hypothetical protein